MNHYFLLIELKHLLNICKIITTSVKNDTKRIINYSFYKIQKFKNIIIFEHFNANHTRIDWLFTNR